MTKTTILLTILVLGFAHTALACPEGETCADPAPCLEGAVCDDAAPAPEVVITPTDALDVTVYVSAEASYEKSL